MSIQIFLQGKLQGTREFLTAAVPPGEGTDGERLLMGRCWWVSLLSEVLPRALLNEFGLSKILLGSSGGGQFLVLLPVECRQQAEEFCAAANRDIQGLTGGLVRLIWATTENLGDWSIVRRRIRESLAGQRNAPLESAEGLRGQATAGDAGYFEELAKSLLDANRVSWSPEAAGHVTTGEGKYSWEFGMDPEHVPFTRHVALAEDGQSPESTAGLAERAEGSKTWGVLAGDVDNLDIRLRRATTVEEHVQLSMLYKQFFAGELEVLGSMPEFWRKVTILYAGGDEFAVFGTWDALVQLARELHRLFRRFSDEYLKDFPGGEGKTISMALELSAGEDLRTVLAHADERLEEAKSSSRDCFALLGRVLEWRQFNGAADLKDTMVRVVREFGGSTQFLRELAAFYREEVFASVSRKREGELERPWRLHRRVLRVLPAKDRDLEKLRNTLILELVGKNASQIKLRPAGRVALEWARLLTAGPVSQ